MIHDLRMTWAFFRSLRQWRREKSGAVVVEVRLDDGRSVPLRGSR